MSIGKIITAARKAKGLKQSHLAAILDVAPPILCDWEHDNHKPSIASIRKLARVLEIDLATLVKAA